MRQAVPPSSVDRLVDFLWQFDEKDPSDPSTWYAPQRREHNMLEVYHHQYLSDDRQDQRIYDAFVDLWDRGPTESQPVPWIGRQGRTLCSILPA